LETIKKVLESGQDVLISEFGKFYAKKKAPRKGRNPATGEDLMLEPRRIVRIKCSSVLVKRINERI
jgi:integration host factor subunit alpha